MCVCHVATSSTGLIVGLIGLGVAILTVALILLIGVAVYCKKKRRPSRIPKASMMTKAPKPPPRMKHNPIFDETYQTDKAPPNIYEELDNFQAFIKPNPAYQQVTPDRKLVYNDNYVSAEEIVTENNDNDYVQLIND